MKKRNVIILVVFLIMGGIAAFSFWQKSRKTEESPEYVFTYAENQAEGYPTTQAAYYFADLVSERSGGRIKIIIYSGGVLGDEVSIIEQLQYGGVDFARASIMTMGGYIPKMNVLQLPYLYSGSEHMWKVLDGEIGQEFMAELEAYALKGLSWYDAGTRNFYTNEKISGLGDLSGKRIRVANAGIMKDLITAFGAVPIVMDYADVYSALERGEIDGAENNWPSYESTDHNKVAPYMILDEHSRIPELQLISQVTWTKLSKADQEIIMQCARESSEYERLLWQQQAALSRANAEHSGVETVELDAAELRLFQEAVKPIYEKYGAGFEDVIEAIMKAGE